MKNDKRLKRLYKEDLSGSELGWGWRFLTVRFVYEYLVRVTNGSKPK